MGNEVIRLTKRFSFEMAHALYNYDGKCRNIHGHSYKLFVTVIGKVNDDPNSPKNGMVCDFSILKKIVGKQIVDVFDHALILNKIDKEKHILTQTNARTILFPLQPTCENLMLHFKELIVTKLPQNLSLINIKLFETEDSYTEWDKNDQT